MPFEADFAQDTEFRKLLTRRADVDLTLAALELARDADPELDFRPTLEWVEARAQELSGAVARAKTDRGALEELSHCLAETHEIFGDPACYERADSSFLHRVIETKRGLPISLSVLYMAVAERIGIDLQGVSAPAHFVTRYEAVDGPLYLDAFSRGRIFTEEECSQWIQSISGLPAPVVNSALKPVSPRTIVIRMLNNLKALYHRQENWSAAWIVQQRLVSLQPTAYQERRDLAFTALQTQRTGKAIDLLRGCLKVCPEEEHDMLQEQLDEALSQQARWN